MLNPEKYLNLGLVTIGHCKIFILRWSKLECLTSSYSRQRCLLGRGGLLVENRWSPKVEWYAKNTGVLLGFYATCVDVYLYTWK